MISVIVNVDFVVKYKLGLGKKKYGTKEPNENRTEIPKIETGPKSLNI